MTEVPFPQFDPTENWENGIFAVDIKTELIRAWDIRLLWWDKWQRHYWDSSTFYISPKKGIKDLAE